MHQCIARGLVVGLAGVCVGASAQTTPLPATQEQVTVTATRSPAAVGETAKTIYQLDGKELHEYPAVTLDEALRQHAGFELFRRSSTRVQNPTSAGISLRGLGSTAASRTLVLEDGAPLNDPFGGWVHWNENPAQTVEAVTLVSGGGSDLYGSSALGGVIDVTPVRPEATMAEASAAAGAQDTGDYQAAVSGVNRQIGGLVAAEVLRTAGYIQTDPAVAGTVDVPSNVHSEAFRTEIGRMLAGDPRVFLTGDVLNEARGNGTPVQTNGTRLWRYLAGYDSPENARVSRRFRGFGSDESYRQSFSAIAANRDSETLTRLGSTRTQELGATADASVRLGPGAVVFGADVRDIRGDDDETPFAKGTAAGVQDVSARQRYVGGFGELLGAKGRWSGAASLRVDWAANFDVTQITVNANGTTRTLPADRGEALASPRLGVVRSFDRGFALHATGFRAFRAPTMNELYRTGQVGQEITLANAALESERATGWEAGLEASKLPGESALTATYFWTEINRPVSAVLISSTATTITNRRENLGQIRSQGVELALNLRPGKAISGSVGYQFADAVVTRFSAQPSLVGKWIPDVPRESASGQVRFAGAKLGELTAAVRYGGKAFDDSSNLYPLAQFFELDVSGQRRVGTRAELFFLMENLTDVRQQVARTPVLTLGSPIFAEGGVRVRLGKVVP